MPRSIIVYIGALAVLAGGVAAAGSLFDQDARSGYDLVTLAFVPLLILAEGLMLRFRYRDQIDACNLFEAALAPLILSYPTTTVMAVVAISQTINGVARRNQPMKATFNIVQWSLAAGIGSLVVRGLGRGLGPGPEISNRNLMVLAVAMVAVVVTNQCAFTYAITLARGEPLRRVITGMAPAYTLGLIAQIPINLTLGLLLAASFSWNAGTIIFFPFPLTMVYWGLRSQAVGVVERSRSGGMRSAIHTIAEQRSDDAVPRFLAQVRAGFDAQAAELILTDKKGRFIHRVVGDPHRHTTRHESSDAVTLAAALMRSDRPVRVTKDSGDMLASLLRSEGWRDCLAAPLALEGRVVGMLCLFNRSGFDGFEDDELSILQLLADETAVARKNELLESKLKDRDRLGDMIKRTSDGLAGIGADGMIKMWNPALEQLTGYSAEEMINTRQMGLIRPKDPDGHDVMIELWARNSAPLPETIQIRTRTGELRWLSCSQTVLPASDSMQPAMLIMLMRDTTRSRELERLKDEFAATVSHELRAPLTPIKGWAATLLMHGDRVSESDREEGVRRILVQAEHLERIIEGVLEMAKIEGGEKSHFESVDLVPLLERAIDEIHQEYPNRVVNLHVGGAHAHPRGNEGWISQIIRNLLTNAVKYSPDDEPVDVSIAETGGEVRISVTDHGQGIPPEDQERIFERFQRLERDSRSTPGAGLGLHIASQLAQAMNGSLAAESRFGSGATFTLTLPAVTSLSIVG